MGVCTVVGNGLSDDAAELAGFTFMSSLLNEKDESAIGVLLANGPNMLLAKDEESDPAETS